MSLGRLWHLKRCLFHEVLVLNSLLTHKGGTVAEEKQGSGQGSLRSVCLDSSPLSSHNSDKDNLFSFGDGLECRAETRQLEEKDSIRERNGGWESAFSGIS